MQISSEYCYRAKTGDDDTSYESKKCRVYIVILTSDNTVAKPTSSVQKRRMTLVCSKAVRYRPAEREVGRR